MAEAWQSSWIQNQSRLPREIEASLGYKVKPCLKNWNKAKQDWVLLSIQIISFILSQRTMTKSEVIFLLCDWLDFKTANVSQFSQNFSPRTSHCLYRASSWNSEAGGGVRIDTTFSKIKAQRYHWMVRSQESYNLLLLGMVVMFVCMGVSFSSLETTLLHS